MSDLIGSWVDGQPGNTLPLEDRGLQYGDGLFETLLIRSNQARFLEAHLARLTAGCARLGIPFSDGEALRAEIGRAANLAPALAVLKVIVTRGSGPRRGYAAHEAQTPRRILTLFASVPVPDSVRAGAVLRVAALRLGENPALAGLKHLNRLENVLAASEPGHRECFDSLLLDAGGHLAGGTMTNLFAVFGARCVTPPVNRCGVAGIMRGIVLREAASLGIEVQQQNLTLDQLLTADEAFVTNARIGVVPVLRVGEHRFRMSDTSQRLASHIEALDA